MFRKLAIIVLSFLALATLAIGVTSYARVLDWQTEPESPSMQFPWFQIEARSGDLTVVIARVVPESEPPLPEPSWSWSLAGAGMSVIPYDWQLRVYVLASPFWMPFMLFAAYPTIAFVRGTLRRQRRRRRNQCVHCGYNLTGNTSGVCPECGTKVED